MLRNEVARIIASVCLLTGLVLGLKAQESRPQLTVIDRVTIFDGTGNPLLKNGVIVVEGQRIRDIGRRGNIRGGPGVTIVDARNKFAIPGLIDAHVHFDQSAGLFARPDAIDLRKTRPYPVEIEETRRRLPATLKRYLASGVTSVVDMGGPMWTLDFRDSVNAMTGVPSVAAAGPLISTVADPQLESSDPPVILMETPEDAIRLVDGIAERRPDLIKILFIHDPGANFDQESGLVEVAIAQAHRHGLRVAVHATELTTAKAALRFGADVLVHSIEDRRIDSEFLGMLRARHVLYIPTLLVTERYDSVFSGKVQLSEIERRLADPEAVQSWGELARLKETDIPGGVPLAGLLLSRPTQFVNLQLLYSADFPVAVGTDAGNIGTPHGPAIHREMELMVEAGMRPFDVLISATRRGSEVMGRAEDLGTLQKGKLADIVLLDADPTRDIHNTQKIFRVMKAGAWVYPEAPQTAR